jgi:phage tail-like protein
MPVSSYDPLTGFKFKVILGTGADIGFMKVSGLDLEVGVFEWQEVSDPVTVWKLPDRIKFSDITLERGIAADDSTLWKWFEEVEEALNSGSPANFRRTCTIQVFAKGDGENPAREWEVYDAFPKNIKIGELDATSSNIYIESLVLAHEGFRLKK